MWVDDEGAGGQVSMMRVQWWLVECWKREDFDDGEGREVNG